MKRIAAVLSAVVTLIIAAAISVHAADVKAIRSISDAADGKGKIVTLEIDLYGLAPSGFIVKEIMPEGWVATDSTPFYRTFDTATGEVKWLFMGGTDALTISYSVVPLGGAAAAYQPAGQILFKDAQGRRQASDIQ